MLIRSFRNENTPTAGRIKVYVDRLIQTRMDVFEEGGSRKRGMPSEPTDGLDSAKRRRLGGEVPERPDIPPLPPGPNSLKDIFTLTKDPALANFDVMSLPFDLMTRITLPVLQRIDQQALNQAVDHVRTRWLDLSKASHAAQLGDDEEDYEPDFQPAEDREQVLNKADALPPEDSLRTPTEVALGPFKLPQPPPLTPAETQQIGKVMISRVFSMMDVLEEPATAKWQKPGINRLAGSTYDKEAWVTVITRLATRVSAGLDDEQNEEGGSKAVLKTNNEPATLSDTIREALSKYIREDFRSRISIGIAWLNEEWFNDRIQKQYSERQKEQKPSHPPKQKYETWVLRVLDGIIPYLDAKDKLLIRFLSEIPEVSEKVLERVKGLAKDPERVQLAVNTLL